jgi:hypothetical protein
MLLCGECYENVYTWKRTNYPSFKVLNDAQLVHLYVEMFS